MDELLVTARLQGHPNVVRLLGASIRPPRPLLALELCRSSLFDVLHGPGGGGGPLPGPRGRARICLDVAGALSYMHGLDPHPLVHRDLKSPNVLLAGDGSARLCDFGLTRRADLGLIGNVVGGGGVAGTPNYLAPELLAPTWSRGRRRDRIDRRPGAGGGRRTERGGREIVVVVDVARGPNCRREGRRRILLLPARPRDVLRQGPVPSLLPNAGGGQGSGGDRGRSSVPRPRRSGDRGEGRGGGDDGSDESVDRRHREGVGRRPGR